MSSLTLWLPACIFHIFDVLISALETSEHQRILTVVIPTENRDVWCCCQLRNTASSYITCLEVETIKKLIFFFALTEESAHSLCWSGGPWWKKRTFVTFVNQFNFLVNKFCVLKPHPELFISHVPAFWKVLQRYFSCLTILDSGSGPWFRPGSSFFLSLLHG